MKKNGIIIKLILLAAPMTLGFVGFVLMERMPLADSLFKCVAMYVLNYGDTPPNFLVELARWTAPLATASGFAMVISGFRDRLMWMFKNLFRDSVAVYGPDELVVPMMDTLGRRGLQGKELYRPAHRYILLMEDRENLRFYTEHLKGRNVPVYMKLDALRWQIFTDPYLKLFSPEETAVRLFWRQAELFQISEKCGHKPRIVLIGFGKLGEELIYWGLQSNIFDPGQQIEYHIFGDCADFPGILPGAENIEDKVIPHDAPWYAEKDLLAQAEMVIVLQQEKQLELIPQLLAAVPERSFTVFLESVDYAQLFQECERLSVFSWQKLAMTAENIFEDKLINSAMAINLRYAHIYSGVEETKENARREWEKLDSFTRYSNISAADYHEIRRRMLREMRISTDRLSEEVLEQLSHLEHIRWSRYHLLNGWVYGVPESGKAKDSVKRIHRDLVPYEQLTEAEKEKDRENIRLLMDLE